MAYDKENRVTPPEIIEPVRMVLGQIELDPATTGKANAIIKADRIYTPNMCGLENPWPRKKAWLSPPKRDLDKWIEKMLFHYRPTMAIMDAHTESQNAQRFIGSAAAICFLAKRVKFYGLDTVHDVRIGQMIGLFSCNEKYIDKFFTHFGNLGACMA